MHALSIGRLSRIAVLLPQAIASSKHSQIRESSDASRLGMYQNARLGWYSTCHNAHVSLIHWVSTLRRANSSNVKLAVYVYDV